MTTWNASNSFRYDDLTAEQKAEGGYRRLGFGDHLWHYNTGDAETATQRSCIFKRVDGVKVWQYKGAE